MNRRLPGDRGIAIIHRSRFEAKGVVQQIRKPLGIRTTELAGGIEHFKRAVGLDREAILFVGKVSRPYRHLHSWVAVTHPQRVLRSRLRFPLAVGLMLIGCAPTQTDLAMK